MLGSFWGKIRLLDAVAQVERFGTPGYYFDADRFRENIRTLRERLPNHVKLCFSLKANPWFVDTALQEADFLETCSAGETQLCLQSGVPPSRLSVGGVSKTEEECARLANIKPHRVSVESIGQLMMLSTAASEAGCTLSVLLRLSSGNQFGMSAEAMTDALRFAEHHAGVEIAGIHYYSGTQKQKSAEIIHDLERLTAAAALSADIREIEYGPGIGVPIFAHQSAEGAESCLSALAEALTQLSEQHSVTVEAGRLLAADAGVYITRIIDIKKNGGRSFWITDGGIHQLSYHGQIGGKPLPRIWRPYAHGHAEPVTICGSLCTVGDILAKDIPLPPATIGEPLVFMNVGAYSVTEARSLFLSRELPVILYQEHGRTRPLRPHLSTFPLNQPTMPMKTQ